MTPPADLDPEPPAEGEDADAPADQGRGAEPRATSATTRTRRRKVAVPASEKTGKRGVYLTDGTWERLQLEAIRKRTTVSAICEEVLARNLPRLSIQRDA